MARRKNGAGALEDTKQLLADTDRQIEDGRRRRADELRGAADESTLDRLDVEIRRLETLAGRHQERIALLEKAAGEAEKERRVREKASLIQRVEKKVCDERQAAAIEIRDGIAKADAGLRKLIAIARDAQAAWPWQGHELAPCLLSPSAIVTAVTHELYKQGARPRLFGGLDTKFDAGIHFPGGKSPRLELAGIPDRIPSLVDVIAEASALASNIMRGKAAAPPATPMAAPADPPSPSTDSTAAEAEPQRTVEQHTYAELLRRADEFAADITEEGEKKYLAIMAQIPAAEAAAKASLERTAI
jgi:hypothetical protein